MMPETVQIIWDRITTDDYHDSQTIKDGNVVLDAIQDCVFCQNDICTQISLDVGSDGHVIVHALLAH